MDFSTITAQPLNTSKGAALSDTDEIGIWQATLGRFKTTLLLVKNYICGKTQTSTAQVSLPASTTAKAPLNIPPGTAPTSPVSGDIWMEGTALKFRSGSTTYTVTAS